MKKFRFDPLKQKDSQKSGQNKLQAAKTGNKSEMVSKQEAQKAAKKSQIQREIDMLNEKIGEANSSIKQTEKLLDIDLFLKNQKNKRLEYAKKLNEEYDREKKQREKKLYKQNQKSSQTQKLEKGTIRSEVPLTIFGAIDQIEKGSSAVKKWVFEGHYHKLDQILLDKTKSQLLGQNMKRAEQQCLKQQNEHSWKRSKEVTLNSSQIKYFPVRITQNQLEPSDLGESLISALTLMPPSLSENLYQECSDINGEKYFLLNFFPGGEKKAVLTDQRIQVREFAHKYVNVGSRSKDNLSFWSTLMEKGLKKLYHKQNMIFTLPQMCQVIYGVDPELIPFHNKVTISQNFPKVLNSLLKNHPKALIGFINDRSQTSQRIYPLVDIHFPEIQHFKKKKHKQLPVKTDILYEIKNPYSGKVLSTNFINKFTLNQLYQKFNRVIVVKELPKKWGGVRIFIDFLSNGPISFTGNSWTQNNQYSFTLNKSSQMRLVLRRRWGSYLNSSTTQSQESSAFGFMLFKSQEGQTEISVLKLDALVYKSKSSDEGGCLFDSLLQKGTYILIPFSHTVNQQFLQLMNLDIYVEKEDYLSLNKAKLNQYYYSNQQVSQEKIIQKLQSKVRYEKPKYEKIAPPKLFHDQGEKPVTITHVESLGLTLMKEAKNDDYFLPGKLKTLLASDEFKEEKREKISKKSAQNEQIQKYEKEETIKILLGYDALMGEDINYGQMKSIVQQTSDQIDLANFHLKQEGLMALLESLMEMPRIVKLDLSHNELNDNVITYLCYYLEKGNRKELRELNLTGNPIGKMGSRALKGLTDIYQDLKIVGIKM